MAGASTPAFAANAAGLCARTAAGNSRKARPIPVFMDILTLNSDSSASAWYGSAQSPKSDRVIESQGRRQDRATLNSRTRAGALFLGRFAVSAGGGAADRSAGRWGLARSRCAGGLGRVRRDRKSTRLNSS